MSRLHLDLPILDTDIQTRLRMRRRTVDYAAIFKRERGPVPRTLHRAIPELAFGQWTTQMRAHFRYPVQLAVLTRQEHSAPIHLRTPHLTFGQIALIHDRRELGRQR